MYFIRWFQFQVTEEQANKCEYPVSGSVRFRLEHSSGVTDSVWEQWRLNRTITNHHTCAQYKRGSMLLIYFTNMGCPVTSSLKQVYSSVVYSCCVCVICCRFTALTALLTLSFRIDKLLRPPVTLIKASIRHQMKHIF